MGNFWIALLVHSVSERGSSFYMTTIVYSFLSVRLYNPSQLLDVTSLIGESHDSITARYAQLA
jgi:arginine exporter protein ArgO